MAFERTNSTPKNIEGMVTDIAEEFPKAKIDDIVKILKNGGLGHYGKTFGDLSTQEICIWIRKESEQHPRRPTF